MLLSLERMFGIGRSGGDQRWSFFDPVRAVAPSALETIGWVFFRAVTFSDSLVVVREMFSGVAGNRLIPGWMLGLAAIMVILSLLEERKGWFRRIAAGPAWSYGLAGAMLLLCVDLIGFTDTAVPFVYFQF